MLIHSRIEYTVKGLDAAQLDLAIASARRAMRQTAAETREPVCLYEVACLNGNRIGYSVQALCSRIVREFVYNYETGELSPLPAGDM